MLIGIEAGGTKFNIGVFNRNGTLQNSQTIPTTLPAETLGRCAEFIREAKRQYEPISAIGIACFGPIELNQASSHYGYITCTPKNGWSNTPIVGFFQEQFGLPIGFNTDVNAAVMAEREFGAGQTLNNLVYVTVGTGIGAGILNEGRLLLGESHLEVGHMFVPNYFESVVSGCCRFHGNACLEGVASGGALHKIWGTAAELLPAQHQAWKIEAKYLAAMCNNLALMYAPKRIVFGGGVFKQTQLIHLIREQYSVLNNAYIPQNYEPESFISVSQLNGQAGLVGAYLLAKNVFENNN